MQNVETWDLHVKHSRRKKFHNIFSDQQPRQLFERQIKGNFEDHPVPVIRGQSSSLKHRFTRQPHLDLFIKIFKSYNLIGKAEFFVPSHGTSLSFGMWYFVMCSVCRIVVYYILTDAAARPRLPQSSIAPGLPKKRELARLENKTHAVYTPREL